MPCPGDCLPCVWSPLSRQRRVKRAPTRAFLGTGTTALVPPPLPLLLQGSVLACDFYNSSALNGLSNEDIIDLLMKELLPAAIPGVPMRRGGGGGG